MNDKFKMNTCLPKDYLNFKIVINLANKPSKIRVS